MIHSWSSRGRRLIPVAAVLLSSLTMPAAIAAGPAWKLRIEAGDVDRSNLPIRVPVPVPKAVAEGRPALKVALADGSQVDGQLVEPTLLDRTPAAQGETVPRELVFVLPKLPAGTSLEVTASVVDPAAPAAAPRLAWADEAAAATLLLSGKPLVRYEMSPYDASTEDARVKTYKPFHHVFDPATGIRLTKGDGGQYTHHRGIFFGYNKISHGPNKKTLSDCWHCTGRSRQEHRRVVSQTAGPVEGVQRVEIDWIGSDAGSVLGEVRELEVAPVAGGTVIDFASRLQATGPVRLDGDPQHSGVHFRASNEVHDSTKGETYYLRPGVKAKPGEFRNWPQDKTYVNAPWHAASFVVGGQRYTVLRVNRPTNPGEARMSERDYARFGSYFEYELTPDKPLEVGYRFWVQPGELTIDEAARIAADYQRPAKVVVRE